MRAFDYGDIGRDVGSVVNNKQDAYGDSFGRSEDIIRAIYGDEGIKPGQLRSFLTVIRVIDKLVRIANAAGSTDPMGEEPWADIAGYALLELGRARQERLEDKRDVQAAMEAEMRRPEAVKWPGHHL